MRVSTDDAWVPWTGGATALALRVLRRLGVRRRYLLAGGSDDAREEPAAIPVEPARLAAGEIEEYLAFRPDQRREAVARRLEEGERCFVGRSAGRMVASVWVAPGSVWLEFVPCRLELAEDAFFVHDLYVGPGLRGKRVADPVNALRIRAMAAEGYTRKVTLYEPENRAAVRRGQRRGNRPLAFLTCWRVGPFRWQRLQPLAPDAAGLVRVAE